MPLALNRRNLLGLAAYIATPGFAQSPPAPTGIRTIVVPLSAGSIADVLARRLSAYLASATGETHIVENVPGAGGTLAARQVLRRPADGRTMLWAFSGLLCGTPLLANPPLDFDPVNELVPVCTMSGAALVLFAGRDFPAGDLAELRAYAKAQAEPVTYVSGDIGTANHLAAESIFQRLGVRGVHVPYRNTQQAFIDVAEGRVQVGVQAWGLSASLVNAGRTKVLAVLADKPLTADPRLRTVAAQGFGAFDVQGWFALLMAKGTPDARVAETERLVQAALNDKAYAEAVVLSGQDVMFKGRHETRRFIDDEVARYRTVLQGLKLI